MFSFFTPNCDNGTPTSGVTVRGNAIYGEGDVGVFELTEPAKSGGTSTISLIYGFDCSNGCELPAGGVTIGSGGVFYGGTLYGGATAPDCDPRGCGILWRLAPPETPGGAWTETVLRSFQGGADGSGPGPGLTEGADGALYGSVGNSSNGYVFRLVP